MRSKRNDRIFLLLSLGILFAGTVWWFIPISEAVIEDISYHVLSSDVVSRPAPLMQGNYGVGLVQKKYVDVPPGDRPQQVEFSIAAGEKFSPYLILINNTNNPFPVLVSAILDYKQVYFTLDGINNLLHYVTIPPKTELNIPLELSIESAGIHDLIFVSFYFPDSHPWLNSHREELLWASVGGRRCVVKVGESDVASRNLVPDYYGNKIENHIRTEEVDFLRITRLEDEDPAQRKLFSARVARGEVFKAELIVKNEIYEQLTNFSVMLFLNYHQVPVNHQDILMISLYQWEYSTVDFSVETPQQPGVHELQAIYILDPYQSLLEDEIVSPFVLESPRVGLIVR